MKICLDCVYLKKGKKETHSYVCVNPKGRLFNSPFPHTHKKTRKACKRYKEKGGLYMDLTQIKGLKFIEDYRDAFQGSDVWVIGGGPNQDYYPADFFDDKTSITLNWSCIAWPNSDYFVADPVMISKIIEKIPNCEKKLVITMSRKIPRGPLPWAVWGFDPIYMKYQVGRDQFEHTKEDFESMAKQLFGGESCEFIIGITQACVGTQVAAALGAKRIILIGCWMAMGDAQERGLSKFYIKAPDHPSADYRAGQHPHQIRGRQSIARFAETFKQYGVEVIRHRFNVEKGEYEFVEVKSEREDLWDTSWGH